MKLRLKRDAIRLRVGPSEVNALAEGGRLVETVRFGPEPRQILVYSLVVGDEPRPRAIFEGREIRIELPPALIWHWAKSTEVAIEAMQAVGRDGTLTILVEKDFACRHGEESDTDVFPNPDFEISTPRRE